MILCHSLTVMSFYGHFLLQPNYLERPGVSTMRSRADPGISRVWANPKGSGGSVGLTPLPRRNAGPVTERGESTSYFANFSPKLYENEENLTGAGGMHRKYYHVDPSLRSIDRNEDRSSRPGDVTEHQRERDRHPAGAVDVSAGRDEQNQEHRRPVLELLRSPRAALEHLPPDGPQLLPPHVPRQDHRQKLFVWVQHQPPTCDIHHACDSVPDR